ncbi:hypothetical protein GOFOIKOB_5785 [Methylobacterium tardum]|uniref:Uncharacterized protein n=1 Tax=Methylobacterium tardum TaxID=374432 RepID=A0AA37T6X7_9HYPH|nr:hypothetical protein [Methylobacterium tardum]URD39567.1 hypothetical protein M6G65_14935 [Methylobacterium tardum]GJE52711.1 hypothetical protein GOFOIKOB_5785 [Methylobacterium tardum]GLS68159.1 hypothetical protein GCM10007890_01710 [Methylobacterium tardum]
MTAVTAHVCADVAGRGLQAFGLMHAAVDGFIGAIQDQQAEDRHEVIKLVAELGRARRVAADAQAAAARLAAENAALHVALARSRAALRGYAAALSVA